MICPHCKAKEHECVPDVAYLNAESYGGGLRKFTCQKCGKIVEATFVVRVSIIDEKKTDEKSDFCDG